MTLNLVHIGRSFYHESGTRMSPLYEIKNGLWKRSDWGKVEIALESGHEVNIRPADLAELGQAHLMLQKMKGD
jgi:hypothetical protein